MSAIVVVVQDQANAKRNWIRQLVGLKWQHLRETILYQFELGLTVPIWEQIF